MVKRDAGAQLRHSTAQRTAQRLGLIARVHVHHALLPRGDNRHQPVLAAGKIAAVVELQILAHSGVHDLGVDGQKAANLGRDLGRGGRSHRKHSWIEQVVQDLGHVEVGRTVAALGARHMMGLVHNHEPDAARRGEARAMNGKELGRGEDDVELPAPQ